MGQGVAIVDINLPWQCWECLTRLAGGPGARGRRPQPRRVRRPDPGGDPGCRLRQGGRPARTGAVRAAYLDDDAVRRLVRDYAPDRSAGLRPVPTERAA